MRPKVNIKSNFSKSIVERVFDESEFMLRNNATLKNTALKFKVSTTTVWVDMRERLPLINPEHYKKVEDLIDFHKKGKGRISWKDKFFELEEEFEERERELKREIEHWKSKYYNKGV